MILSGQSWNYLRSNTEWTSNNIYTYLRVQPNADLTKIKGQIDKMVEKYMGAEIEKYIGISLKEFNARGDHLGLFMQPMLDIHLKSALSEEITPNGNI